jgi:hypothetical protein
MRLLLLLLILLSGVIPVNAQQSYQAPRILFLLDGSAGMMQKVDSVQTKYELAKKIILNIVDSAFKINHEVEFALRVNGNQFDVTKGNCEDSRLEVKYSMDNYGQLQLRLDDIRPKGKTSLTFGIEESFRNELQKDIRYKQTIIIISSGENTCSMPICDSSLKKHFDQLYCKPYTVLIGNNSARFECLGDHSIINSDEGKYFSANSTLEHCKRILAPRDKNYRVSYGGLEKVRAQNIKVAQLKSSVSIPIVISTDSGFLKISENFEPNVFKLVNDDNGQMKTIQLSKIQSYLLSNKDLLALKTGNYIIEYNFSVTDTLSTKRRSFIIKKNMVTEIKF